MSLENESESFNYMVVYIFDLFSPESFCKEMKVRILHRTEKVTIVMAHEGFNHEIDVFIILLILRIE